MARSGKKSSELRTQLAKLERRDPKAFKALVQAYLAEGTAAFGIFSKKRGRQSRPDIGPVLWAEVRAIMLLHNIGHPAACKIIAERNEKSGPWAFSVSERGRTDWQPILNAKTLARHYRAANRLYKALDPDSKLVHDTLLGMSIERQK